MKNIVINSQFKNALDLIEGTGTSVFITGKAGTGKSTFIKYARQNIRKNMVVLAPTGVAALNVKGETIHSFFQFKPGVTLKEAERFVELPRPGEVKMRVIKECGHTFGITHPLPGVTRGLEEAVTLTVDWFQRTLDSEEES